MKKTTARSRLQRELRRLFRSMDFVSRHPALEKEGAEAERFAEIYQQLGLAWEFLAGQCGHWDGFRRTRSGRAKCAICGRFEDAADCMVRLDEGGVECWLDTHLIRLRLAPRKKGQAPPRAAFPWELSRARLKRFPVLIESDEDGKFAGVSIFKPTREKAARKKPAR